MKITKKTGRNLHISQSNQKDNRSENKVLPDVPSVLVVHSVPEKKLGKAVAQVELEESQTEPWEEMEV